MQSIVGYVTRSATPTEQSAVSVDVLVLRFVHSVRRAHLAVAPRQHKPYMGRLALPGVLLGRGERLADAAVRAAKTKLGLKLSSTGQLATFDKPHRDPRGPTLSLAMWGVTDELGADTTRWFDFAEVPPLAFDHNRIVDDTRPILADLLWRNREFTEGLTGSSFPVADAVGLTHSLEGSAPDRGNLNRVLRTTAGLVRPSHVQRGFGSARPSCACQWES